MNNRLKRNGENIRTCTADIEWIISKNTEAKEFKRIKGTFKAELPQEDTKKVLSIIVANSLTSVFNDSALYQSLLNLSKESKQKAVVNEMIQIPKVNTPAILRKKELFKELIKSVVTIEHSEGHGSGFFISDDGYIITNHHVVKNKKTVNVKIGESITLSADIIRVDDDLDVALLKVTGEGFVPLQILSSDSVSQGEDVYAIGAPQEVSLGQSVSKGIVSGKRILNNKMYIQTDASINKGNSGGPLLNDEGKVVGVVSAKLIGEGIEGVGFCIPMEAIMENLNIRYK